MEIRNVTEKDYPEIEKLVKEAFEKSEYGYNNENEIITKIRTIKPMTYFERIVVENDEIIGYGMLSSAAINWDLGLVLAPLAVKISHQNQGIGAILMKDLEEITLAGDYPFIHILGNPDYYGKFGYQKASQFEITPPFKVESKYFLIKELFPSSLTDISGQLTYNPAFD